MLLFFECVQGWCSLYKMEELKDALMRAGLLLRLHAPQQIIRGQEVALQQRMRWARQLAEQTADS